MKRIEITQQTVNQYLAGKSIRFLVNKLGIHPMTISKRLKERGIIIRKVLPKSKTYDCDTMYFKKIDNEQKAYWLGFIFAEGWLSESIDKRNGVHTLRFGIELSQKDIHHLHAFKQAVQSQSPIKKRLRKGKTRKIPLCYIRIGNRAFCDCLLQYFQAGKKSHIIELPSLSSNLMRHFIRGYFDGDGCITKQGHISFTSNSSKMLYQLEQVFKREVINYVPAKKLYKYKGFKRWKLARSKLKALPIYEYMYEQATIKLQRKYDRYCQIFSLEQ